MIASLQSRKHVVSKACQYFRKTGIRDCIHVKTNWLRILSRPCVLYLLQFCKNILQFVTYSLHINVPCLSLFSLTFKQQLTLDFKKDPITKCRNNRKHNATQTQVSTI